ncbi:MAG: Spy/CpxP family protein refolding chaperone [Heteroscytonema crispum UTEX LB 1556]
MKLKLMSILAGAIALSFAATPLMVNAQPNPTAPLPGEASQPFKKIEGLNLTQEQKDKMKEIRENTRAQIQGILTAEQQQQFQTAAQSGQRQRPRQVFASLNLTEQQKTQIRQIMQTSKQQMQAVLTPEQQQKVEQFRNNRRSRWQQRNSQ